MTNEALPHLPVVIGLVAGTLAKYGLDLEGGVTIRPGRVVGHCMMLLLLGMLAEFSSDLTNGPPMVHAIAGAAAALLSSKAVRRFRDAADRRAAAQMGEGA